jgi:membrane protease YdiL (CAAX protease family)
MSELKRQLGEAFGAAAAVTALVGVIAAFAPVTWHAALVGLTFLGATWALVWCRDDERVRRAGLELGGLVMPGRLGAQPVVRDAARSLGWALGASMVVAVPYYFGWRLWWAPPLPFSLKVSASDLGGDALGQLLVIALPEEAFYRGYLQSRLDDAWPPRWRLLGAQVGPGLLVAAAIFATGHIVTVHAVSRLAVFFPALLFGWLRARTGGIGASVCFHAFCNLGSQLLGRGYGMY